jgi:hypothetical protein
MPDPTGSIGARPDLDFGLLLKGGTDFVARLQQLADARDQHDAALAQLKLGQDVAAALDAAQGRLADASRMQAAATKTLADAKRDAAAIRADADRLRAVQEKLLRDTEEKNRQVIQAAARTDAAWQNADAKQKELDDKLGQLRAALRAIS